MNERTQAPGRGSASKTCSVEGCERPLWKIGYCIAHAKRWYRTGSVGSTPIRDTTYLKRANAAYISRGMGGEE